MRAIKITVVGLALLLSLGTVGCDTTATFRISEVQFDPVAPLRIIGTTPVKRDPATQTFVPACSAGETAEGMRITFALKSTEQKGSTSGNKDRLVRDGDRISGKIVTVGPGQAISAEKFTFGPDNANTIEEVRSFDNEGNAKPLASISPVAVNFVPRTANKNESVAVALLIDHSGSMVGQVDPTNYFEVKTLAGSAPISERTDKFGKRFVAAGTSLIANLNASDKLIAWTFNEKGLRLACSAVTEVANEPLLAEEQLCFTSQHSLYYNNEDGTGGITDTNNESTQGRTPLWRAVKHAWDFLNQNAPGQAKHIVVLTDSPDTCSSAGDWWIQDEPCQGGGGIEVAYADFKSAVDAALPESRIPVSFIQLQSKGYLHPDPAQMEAACLTGGTYQWINNMEYAQDGETLSRELKEAFENVRDTLSGVWHLDTDVLVLSNQDYIKSGQIAALDGQMTLSGTNLLPTTATVQFKKNLAANDADTRLLVRTACQANEDCPGAGGLGECDAGCLLEGSGCAPADMKPLTTNEDCCCGQPLTDFTSVGTWSCDYLQEPCCNPAQVDKCKAKDEL